MALRGDVGLVLQGVIVPLPDGNPLSSMMTSGVQDFGLDVHLVLQGVIAPLPKGDPFSCLALGFDGVLARLAAPCKGGNATLQSVGVSALQARVWACRSCAEGLSCSRGLQRVLGCLRSCA